MWILLLLLLVFVKTDVSSVCFSPTYDTVYSASNCPLDSCINLANVTGFPINFTGVTSSTWTDNTVNYRAYQSGSILDPQKYIEKANPRFVTATATIVFTAQNDITINLYNINIVFHNTGDYATITDGTTTTQTIDGVVYPAAATGIPTTFTIIASTSKDEKYLSIWLGGTSVGVWSLYFANISSTNTVFSFTGASSAQRIVKSSIFLERPSQQYISIVIANLHGLQSVYPYRCNDYSMDYYHEMLALYEAQRLRLVELKSAIDAAVLVSQTNTTVAIAMLQNIQNWAIPGLNNSILYAMNASEYRIIAEVRAGTVAMNAMGVQINEGIQSLNATQTELNELVNLMLTLELDENLVMQLISLASNTSAHLSESILLLKNISDYLIPNIVLLSAQLQSLSDNIATMNGTLNHFITDISSIRDDTGALRNITQDLDDEIDEFMTQLPFILGLAPSVENLTVAVHDLYNFTIETNIDLKTLMMYCMSTNVTLSEAMSYLRSISQGQDDFRNDFLSFRDNVTVTSTRILTILNNANITLLGASIAQLQQMTLSMNESEARLALAAALINVNIEDLLPVIIHHNLQMENYTNSILQAFANLSTILMGNPDMNTEQLQQSIDLGRTRVGELALLINQYFWLSMAFGGLVFVFIVALVAINLFSFVKSRQKKPMSLME